jgi:hypothetical protein
MGPTQIQARPQKEPNNVKFDSAAGNSPCDSFERPVPLSAHRHEVSHFAFHRLFAAFSVLSVGSVGLLVKFLTHLTVIKHIFSFFKSLRVYMSLKTSINTKNRSKQVI